MVNCITQTVEEGISCVAQESLSNKTEETVAQNTPSQDDPFPLFPSSSAPGPQKGMVFQAVTVGGGQTPKLNLEQGRQQSLVPGQGLNQ